MRARLLCASLLAVAAIVLGIGLAAASGQAQSDTVFSTQGKIARLAASGNVVAATTTKIASSCDKIVDWFAPGSVSHIFKSHVHCPGGETSGGQSLLDVAIGDSRVAWIESAAGNTDDLTLYEAYVNGGPAAMVAFANNGNGAEGDPGGDYVAQLYGSGPLLAFNSWTLCSEVQASMNGTSCPMYLYSNEKLWRIKNGSKSVIGTGPPALKLVAAGGGDLAILGKTTITVLNPTGAQVGQVTFTAPAPKAVALSTNRLVVQRAGKLYVYTSSGAPIGAPHPLGGWSSLKLTSATPTVAVLRGYHKLGLFNLLTGVKVLFPLPAAALSCACPVDARVTLAGLFYAYNVPGPVKGRIVFENTAALLAKF